MPPKAEGAPSDQAEALLRWINGESGATLGDARLEDFPAPVRRAAAGASA